MPLTTTDGQVWPDIAPQADDRESTCNRFLRFGSARAARSTGGFDHYGIFGIRGDQVFVQYEGGERDGKHYGVAVVTADADSNVYFWSPVSSFADIRVFDDLFALALRAAEARS